MEVKFFARSENIKCEARANAYIHSLKRCFTWISPQARCRAEKSQPHKRLSKWPQAYFWKWLFITVRIIICYAYYYVYCWHFSALNLFWLTYTKSRPMRWIFFLKNREGRCNKIKEYRFFFLDQRSILNDGAAEEGSSGEIDEWRGGRRGSRLLPLARRKKPSD